MRKRISSTVISVSIAALNAVLARLGVLDVKVASVLNVTPVELIVSTLVYPLLLRNWNCPCDVPPMLTSKYILLPVPLYRLRIAPSRGICRATLLIAASPAMNAVAALLVTPVSVPMLVMLGWAAPITVTALVTNVAVFIHKVTAPVEDDTTVPVPAVILLTNVPGILPV